MQANLSLIRGDTLPLSIDSINVQGTEEKYILSDTDIIHLKEVKISWKKS